MTPEDPARPPADPSREEAVVEVEGLAAEARDALERLTRLAARLVDTPVALVNLVHPDRQISVARTAPPSWPAGDELPISESFCRYAVWAREPMLVEDARQDPRVRETRLVSDLGVGSYLGVPLEDSGGEVVGTLCVVDFTPRRWRADEVATLRELTGWVMTVIELRRSLHETAAAERLAEIADRERREKTALLESTSEGIYGIDLEGRCTFINPAGAKILGYSPEECLGENMHRLIHHSHPDGSPFPVEDCPIYRAVAERRSIRLDDQVLWRRDGSSFPAEYSSAPVVVDGALTGAVVTFDDVADRRRGEANERFFNRASKVLAASTLDYAATLRSLVRLTVPSLGDWATLLLARDGGGVERLELAHSDPEKQALADELQRYPVDPTSDHPSMRVLRTGEPLLFSEMPDGLLEKVARDEEHLRILRALEMKSGMVVPLIARERTLGVLTIASTDPGRRYGPEDLRVAEEFAHRAALAADNARLFRESQQANRAKAEFMATVSHELRTPLNAIVGYTELLREGVPVSLPAAALSYVDRIELSSRHLRQLIEEILSFSRLESGQERIAIGVARLPELAENVRALIEPLAQEKGLALEIRLPEKTRPLKTDVGKLRQILVNLLDNAVKFTQEGSVQLEVEQLDGETRLSVKDTGQGIREEDLGRIFEPFHQLEQSSVREQGGTGLGLSVVLRLVELLGARVEVESEVGRGTAFHVWLPREAPAPG